MMCCGLQGWIRKAVRGEVACGSVELEGLLEGRAASFVHVHSAAMLALVSEPAPIRADDCPETLLLDAHRLGQMQREFQYEVTAAALMATATHCVAATKNAADMQVWMPISPFTFKIAIFVCFACPSVLCLLQAS